MKWIILAALVAATLPFLKVGNYKPEERYKQWYVPFVLLLEALYFTYYYVNYSESVHTWLNSLGLSFLATYFQYAFVIACMFVMLGTKKALQALKLYDLIEKHFPNTKMLSKSGKYNDTFYYFPYVKDPMGTRPGIGYLYRFFFCIACLTVGLIAVDFILEKWTHRYFIESGLFAFCIPIFVEFYNFYNTSLVYNEPEKEEEEAETSDNASASTLENLYTEYVDTFKDSFDVAFSVRNTLNPQNIEKQNENSFNTLLEEFKAGKDIIVEDLDIPSSFHRLSDVFFNSLTSGGNILILVDIPERHNKKQDGKDVSMMELFSVYLSNYLQKNVPNANEILKISYLSGKAGEDQYKSRIILASVSTILDSDIQGIQWFDDLDLLLAINQSDKGRVNYFENQKFNLLIEKKNKSFRTVILSPFRQGLQTSMTRVWKLDRTCEKRISTTRESKNHFCLLSNFEKWHENWLKQATPLGTNLYSGIELAIPAINFGVDKITYLEINNAEIREGREALGTSRNHITKYDLARKDFDKIIEMNQLPFYMFGDKRQQFSIIYDVENNSPSMYIKWLHLGKEDNFSIVISKPYLFKSYFADNMQLFKRAPMLAIEPVPSLSRVNLAILLYNILREGKVAERQIKRIINDYDISLGHQSTPVFLRELFIRYFNFDIEENSRLQVEETVVFDKNGYEKSYAYSLAPFKITHFPQFAPLRQIKIIDNRGILRFTILKDMLFQNYLPRQKHIFNGRTFEITSYDDIEGAVTIRNLPQFNNHLFYSTCFKLSYSGKVFKGDIEDYVSFNAHDSEFTLIQFEASVDVDTPCYYEFRKAYEAITQFNNQEVFRVDLTSNEQQIVKRHYRNCRVMKLEWKLKKDLKESIPKIQAGLHLLLVEAFKSFFPYSCQYLIVCSNRSGLTSAEQEKMQDLAWIFPSFESENNDNCIEIFFFEDSISDMGVLNAIRENYVYIFQYIYDYLCWLEETSKATGERPKADIASKKYINNIGDKLRFLKYGFKEVPSFIDVALLKEFAEIHFPLDKVSKNELINARRSAK